ncbi:MAG TPA: type IV toxin-antitoxin system AbiEi family antitoxin domain-containing protein [Acidimicrobiales bacterium]|nr:type IV toxin-antitoxin system AbiEi family antitoxin domain-containing protein [Acidimicrobiales bacterium]
MKLPEVTRRVLQQARRQGWVITRAEVLELGAHPGQVSALIGSGLLIRRHPGVFIVAGAPDDHAVHVRATLAALGPEAMASHGTAAWLQDLLERPPRLIHVTAGESCIRRLDGVRVHRTHTLPWALPYRGIRCTPPARTLIDLAVGASPGELSAAVDRGLAKRTVRLSDIEGELRKPSRPGTGHLRRCLVARGFIGAPAPSVLESAMCRLMVRYGLPVPRAEVVAGPDGRYRIDFAYVPPRVALEVYGYERHHSPEEMAYDLERQRRLTLQGWKVLIFTWRDVTRTPDRVAAQIRAALGSAA